VIRVERGYVEWDLADAGAEEYLFEVGVRAALVRRGIETEKIASLTRGVHVRDVEVKSREKFNVYVQKDVAKLLSVAFLKPITREQVRTARRMGKIVELRLRPLLKQIHVLKQWLDVLDPEIVVFSTPVFSPWDVKSPKDVEALLVELSGDESWRDPVEKGLDTLVELALDG